MTRGGGELEYGKASATDTAAAEEDDSDTDDLNRKTLSISMFTEIMILQTVVLNTNNSICTNAYW